MWHRHLPHLWPWRRPPQRQTGQDGKLPHIVEPPYIRSANEQCELRKGTPDENAFCTPPFRWCRRSLASKRACEGAPCTEHHLSSLDGLRVRWRRQQHAFRVLHGRPCWVEARPHRNQRVSVQRM